MRKVDVLRFHYGDVIEFIDQPNWNGKGLMPPLERRQTATVLDVTERGGVRVRLDDGSKRWVPYHYISRRLERSRLAG